jgi:hypothetical protein
MILISSRIGLALLLALSGLPAWSQGQRLTDGDVRKMEQECEAMRQEKLAPIRAQKTQTCIEQQLKSPGHCERYYTTYGNVSPGPSGAPQQGYFYNLPECQLWLESRETLQASRSRP